jgi:diphosphomevalonate decarboxylase
MKKASAMAPVNIALVKYWGKRDASLNLPSADSLSVSLDALCSHTTVFFDGEMAEDQLTLNGQIVEGVGLEKAQQILNHVRGESGVNARAKVVSRNNFPTGAGLASSASGMAALALAASRAAGWDAPLEAISGLARLGSGSACRSVYGGFVHWQAGVLEEGADSHGIPFASPEDFPLRVFVAVVDGRSKAVSSTQGMAKTAETSPYYENWVRSVGIDMPAAMAAVEARDFQALGAVAERSCLCMHAAMMSTVPPLFYWRPGTLAVLEAIRTWRAEGAELFFTIDAGPNVKVFVPPHAGEEIRDRLADLDAVEDVLVSGLGSGAQVVDEHLF